MIGTSLVTINDIIMLLLIFGILGTIVAIYHILWGGEDDLNKI